ncbi:MAG: FdhF/YdeP family oxidoreductase [Gammaproteobacteria bacterium]|nr:FdhF/YdeP family oxidoreductase [Gammaproteobacteria bacterium]
MTPIKFVAKNMTQQNSDVGGGIKKILYALRTLRSIGLQSSSKALMANNTCKACGLGMGGQQGGMKDEQGTFPSVCNKSVQAQSTDIQAPIPKEIFSYTLNDFKALNPRELEQIGRLGNPIYKDKGKDKFNIVTWEWALEKVAQQLSKHAPNRSFFYSSGRSSNEAGFVLQLFARLYGTNNINNCSYYCHQATGVGLSESIGSGTATVELADLDKCDTIFLIGANPASNHPRLIYKLKACRERGGNVVVINPAKEAGLVKFATPKSARSLLTGGSEIASHYVQPNIGSDHFLLSGIAKALIENDQLDIEFIETITEGFTAYSDSIRDIDWSVIEKTSGIDKDTITNIASLYAQSSNVIFAWGMGITHHKHGVSNVQAIANLALLRAHIGKQGAGLLPLRGHSNVQGIGTVGVKPVLPQTVLESLRDQYNIDLFSHNDEPGLDTLACIESAHAGNIDNAFIMGGNLYQATPNSRWASEALDRIGFKCFLTTTLNYGHLFGNDNSESLILPICARDEEPEPTTQESMFNFVRLSDGGIQRVADARSEVHVLSDIASRTLDITPLDFGQFKSFDTVRETIANVIPGMGELQDIAHSKQEFHIPNRILHDLQIPSNRGKFIAIDLEPPAATEEYPFTLASVRSEGQFNSIIYEETDSYRNNAHRWSVFLCQRDIKKLGMCAGDTVTLRSEVGIMENVTIQAFDLPPGNAMAYYPEANCLIGLERDPQSKTPAFKSVKVSIS